jgi:uncharacterized membrane protein required for colicin V production
MNSLSLQHSPLNWFDLLVVIVIMLGIRQGRKNGMSVELTPMLQWITIVAVCAVSYRFLGDWLADSCPMQHVFCYITVYILMAIVIKCVFSVLKKLAGGKLTGSDIFGRAEFYLGMVGGAVRFLCILIAGLALLNAPYYSAQEIASNKAYQVDMYGSTFFPGLSNVQIQIFKESFLGGFLKKDAEFMLIASTKAEHKDLPRKKDDLP